MIHYISPYDSSPEKNIGGAINRAVEQLNASDEDWVVHVDQDVMWLLPDSKKQLEAILSACPVCVLGCVTNRLAMPTQLCGSGMFEETDVGAHVQQAKILQSENNNKTVNTNEPLAAFMLCFKVSTWKHVGKFVENDLRFDTQFCINAQSAGLTLSIATGIYVFHLYRLGQSGEARRNYKHLLPET